MARKKNSSVIKAYEPELTTVCRSMRFYREQMGMEQKELAMRLGVSANTLSNWETGVSKPNVNMVVPICGALGISLYKLFGLEEPAAGFDKAEQDMVSAYRGLSPYHKRAVADLIHTLNEAEEAEAVPELTRLIYFSRQLAAGIGDPTEFEEEGEPIYLYSSEKAERADYVFTVNGESMEPEYRNGDMVLIKKYPDCGEIRSGQVGAFMVGNETYIKEYRPDGLHSFNPRYKPLRFGEEESVYCIGRVIGTAAAGEIATEQDIKRYRRAHGEELE